jgi:acetyl-CoA carboxylase carboxyltransferase component
MTILKSRLDPRSDEFKGNASLMRDLVADLRAKTETVARGGSEESRQRHLSRGKLLPRDRIGALDRSRLGDARAVAARRVRHVRRRRARRERHHLHRPRLRDASA